MANDVNSTTRLKQESNEVLAKIYPGYPCLDVCGFMAEKSEKKEGLISVPIFSGANEKVEKSFDADTYLKNANYVAEAGRAVVNYQSLKDSLLPVEDLKKLLSENLE